MTSRAPLPAASIMTLMMLFALTRGSLRDSHTAQRKALATCVSLAEARACRPSLLTISTSARAIARLAAGIVGHVHHAFGAARERFRHHCLEPLLAVGEGADQHRQVDPGDALDLAWLEQAQRDVARRRAVEVGEHEHAVAFVALAHQLLRLRQHRFGVVVHRDADLAHAQRPLAEHVARRMDERLAEGAVRDDEDSDHRVLIFRSSESQNIPATSKSVWSWISRIQVMLVSLIMV